MYIPTGLIIIFGLILLLGLHQLGENSTPREDDASFTDRDWETKVRQGRILLSVL